MSLVASLDAFRALNLKPSETSKDVRTLHALLSGRKHDQIIKFLVSRSRLENAYLGQKYQAFYGDKILLAPELRAKAFGSLSLHGSDVVNGADQTYEASVAGASEEGNGECFALVPQAYYYGEALRGFFTTPAEYDAYCIWDSLTGSPDSPCFNEILELLAMRSASEICEAEKHFLTFSGGKPLGDAMIGEIIPRTDLHRLVTSFLGFLEYKKGVAHGALGSGTQQAASEERLVDTIEHCAEAEAVSTPSPALATPLAASPEVPPAGARVAQPSATMESAWEALLIHAVAEGEKEYTIESDAKYLYQASKEFKNKELAFFEVFLFRPREHLAALPQKYEAVNGVTLEATLNAEFPGIIAYTFTLLMEYAMCPARAYAHVLHQALSEDRDRTVLRTMLSCYDKCMPQVLQQYKEMYGKELPKALKGISSGNFRALLLAMCQRE